MKREAGYIVSVVGIGVMAIGFQIIKPTWEILNIVPTTYIGGLGVALVGIGVIISLMGKRGGKSSRGDDEIPIYEGTGRHRRIVGYRKG
jgi:hypothetical protein